MTPPNSQRQLVQQNQPKDLRKAHLRLRNFVLQKKTHPKILPSTPAICLYTLWTFTMMFFRANLTQSTLSNARTINLKRPTNWGRHPIHSKFPICSAGLHDFRSISNTISNVFLIFLSSWYFLSYMYVSLIQNIMVGEYYYKRWQSCEIHCVECNMISHTYNTNNTHISWLDDINLHLPLHARWYLDWVKLDWHISWSFNCICVPI